MIFIALTYVSHEGHSSALCIKSVSATKSQIGELFENRVYAVHITNFLPTDGIIRAVSKNRGRFAATVHFSLGEPVVDHPWGNWSNKSYAIAMPVKSLRDQILNLYPQDTFVLGDVKIPSEAVVFVPKEEKNKVNFPCRVIVYDSAAGVKPAIQDFLVQENTIQFNTESGFNKATHWGSRNIMEGRRLQRIFSNLFLDKPYLTRTSHDFTVWGDIDYRIIDYFSDWMSGETLKKIPEENLTLAIHRIHDSLTEVGRVVSHMNLPSHARDSFHVNIKELKSYLNLLEAENFFRGRGRSILALQDKKIILEILSKRFHPIELQNYLLKIENDLPIFNDSIQSFGPYELYRVLEHSSIQVFIQKLKENFKNPDAETLKNMKIVTALKVLRNLKAGKLTSEEALQYFYENAQHLPPVKLQIEILDTLYRIATDESPEPFPNSEVLKFLRNKRVHDYLVSQDCFKYFKPEMMKLYEKRVLNKL